MNGLSIDANGNLNNDDAISSSVEPMSPQDKKAKMEAQKLKLMQKRKGKHAAAGRIRGNDTGTGTFSPGRNNMYSPGGSSAGPLSSSSQKSNGANPKSKFDFGRKDTGDEIDTLTIGDGVKNEKQKAMRAYTSSAIREGQKGVREIDSDEDSGYSKEDAQSKKELQSKMREQGISPIFDPTENMGDTISIGGVQKKIGGERKSKKKKKKERKEGGKGEADEDSEDAVDSKGQANKPAKKSCLRKGDLSALDLENRAKFLNEPLPYRAGTVQCYIVRNKSGMMGKVYPTFELYMETDRLFLMSAKKRKNNKTSNYLISKDQKSMSKKDNESYMGKVRSNFVGTEFTVFDAGSNPKDTSDEDSTRAELSFIQYESNILGNRGPRKMVVCLPETTMQGERELMKATKGNQSMSQKVKKMDLNGLTVMSNKRPQWNDHVGAYVLNFEGRVTMASVKNFQLVEEGKEDEVLLQFGRVEKDKFTLDFSWPLSPLQAFGICLSSFDYKLACE